MIQYIEKNTDKVISLKLCKLQRRTNMEKYRRLKYYLLSMTKNDEKRVLRSDELESKFQDIVDNKMIPIGQTGHKAIQVDFSDGCVVENISKVSKKNICKLVTVTVITIIVTIVLFVSPILNSSDILALGNDFQFNVLSFSGVIAVFMFTGIGILISAIDKE